MGYIYIWVYVTMTFRGGESINEEIYFIERILSIMHFDFGILSIMFFEVLSNVFFSRSYLVYFELRGEHSTWGLLKAGASWMGCTRVVGYVYMRVQITMT